MGNLKVWAGVVAMVGCTAALSQPVNERFALQALEKGKWTKAESLLTKALKRDSLQPYAHYLKSVYFLSAANPAYHIDSAYTEIIQARQEYRLSPQRLRDRLKRYPLDSPRIEQWRMIIDSVAFVRAKQSNTEVGYVDFIQRFPEAIQLTLASELRDEVAYLDALKENTYTSFERYLEKYPRSARAPDAQLRYDKLLFETKTRSGKRSAFEAFLQEHPQSPYRPAAERAVFEVATAEGSAKAYELFIAQYPGSSFAKQAVSIGHYLLRETDEKLPPTWQSDSLAHAMALEQLYLVPFIEGDRIGFMSATGVPVMEARFQKLPEAYRCGNITDDVLVLDSVILTRNGYPLFRGPVRGNTDLGYGFVKVDSDSGAFVIHKSGLQIFPKPVTDAWVLGGRFIALQEGEDCTVYAFNGRKLLNHVQTITSVHEVVAVKSHDGFKLMRVNDLAALADLEPPVFSPVFDSIAEWPQGIWVKLRESEGLLSAEGQELIPLTNGSLTNKSSCILFKSAEGFRLWKPSYGFSSVAEEVKVHAGWHAVRRHGQWQVLNENWTPSELSISPDSIVFSGPLLLGYTADSLHIFFTPGYTLTVSVSARVQVIAGRDSEYFVMVSDPHHNVYDHRGQLLFSLTGESCTYAGDGLFMVTVAGKKGICFSDGRWLVEPNFDALIVQSAGRVQTLKDKKFGMIDLPEKKEIKPVFTKSLHSYNGVLLIASQDGRYGLIDWSGKAVLPFAYEEIRYWTDSIALVKANYQWMLYNFVTRAVEVTGIRKFTEVRTTPEESIIIFQQDNQYGVRSNRKGIILQSTYNDIINVGSSEQPLYFTEKHVEEASIFVIIWYDSYGKLIRRQVMEEEDYDKIYCNRN